ncbi:permease [Ilumatobacter nonamiensis]|uniref:permease n=1 Tax=Ilumatobacter nonamiensis TaxID=467093 RepID=UPI00034DB9D8|nr:permease [Ilumatobacter nonamiensis]
MTSTIMLLVELVVLFVGVSFLVEILQRRFGPERLRRWMGGRPVAAALKGIVIGFITPFCTYSAIPLLVGMRRAGVPPAGYVAFISAAPVLDPILFGALWLIVGPTVAVIYFVVTFVAALALALTAQRFGTERQLKPVADRIPTPERVVVGVPDLGLSASEPVEDHQCTENVVAWQGWRTEARSALASSRALLRSFGPLLLLGVAIGIAIEAVVSPEAAARLTTGSPWLAIPTASALGTPLYFSTELFVPIANSLHTAGVGVGAIVALTIAGAGANVPEFIVLSKMAAHSVIAAFFAYVFAVAMVGGLLAHTISG